jgi:hypothetical protein
MSANNGYIPSADEQKQTKAFKLAPVETPEEEARDMVLRQVAPQLRRQVREDERLSAPAKFLFDALFDDCFWRKVGGNGTGQVFADIRTLADRYKHDEKSIRAWRDELIEAGWLWVNYEWPMTEWRITPLMPAPTDYKHKKAVQMALGRAAADSVGKYTDTPRTAGNGQKTSDSGQSPTGNGKTSRQAREANPPSVGKSPAERGNLYPQVVGQVPTGDGIGSHDVRDTFPQATGQVPTGDGIGSHGRQEPNPKARQFASSGHGKSGARETALGELERVGEAEPQRLDNRACAPGSENDFLEMCLEVMGNKEMRQGGPKGEGNGALWRVLFRQNPQKAWRVMEETKAVKRERPLSLKKSWGAYAMNLWKENYV